MINPEKETEYYTVICYLDIENQPNDCDLEALDLKNKEKYYRTNSKILQKNDLGNIEIIQLKSLTDINQQILLIENWIKKVSEIYSKIDDEINLYELSKNDEQHSLKRIFIEFLRICETTIESGIENIVNWITTNKNLIQLENKHILESPQLIASKWQENCIKFINKQNV
ncbi:hypothetical protein A3Q56_07200 [Intoshia linei]|uniref:Uncharacterized protein n=1 Tax=Intoshia linei TaxID=1819745 RepID=A0A177AST5_9BILA|nr:hypothetical protein A3Q56_07200 [Intoshia linei]